MRGWRQTGAALALAVAALPGAATVEDDDSKAPAPTAPSPASRTEARRRFEDGRFGLFIDWGVHTLLGKGPAVMERDRLPVREYEKLPPRFNPTGFDPEVWAKVAVGAGAKSLAVTAKGPDGFCMFDSAATRYDIVDATPFAKDPLKALADACHKQKVPLVAIYSLADWHHPDAEPPAGREADGGRARDRARYVAYARGQLRELCTRYGPLGGVWLDHPGGRAFPDDDLAGTCRLIHDLQPSALVGVRLGSAGPGAGPSGFGEDVRLFDLELPDAVPHDRPASAEPGGEGDAGSPLAEVALPIGRAAGPGSATGARHAGDAGAVIRGLAAGAGRGANLRVGVAATADGALAPEVTARLAEVGRWLGKAGESVYGTRRGPIPPQPWGVSTRKAGSDGPPRVYLHVFDPEGPLILPGASVSLTARLLGGTKPLPMTRADGRAVVTIPEAERDPLDTVLVLTPEVLEPAKAIRR
jgi:alpha-L-fucosidase